MHNKKKIIAIILFLSILALGINTVCRAQETILKDKNLSLNLKDAFKVKTEGNADPLDTAAFNAGYDTAQDKTSPEYIISAIIKAALSFLGVVFLILMIYGGYIWMTARGNEQNIEKAKNLITAAVTGLLIVLAAYAISYFVIEKLGTGTLK